MTNPNNAVGTSAAYGGRTSADAFGDGIAAFSRGILSGWACAPKTGMKVEVGGTSGVRDVLVAEDNAGNKTTINNISASPIEVTISAAPGANTRIDAVVAYVDNPPQGTSTIVDNYEACGLIAVDGTASSSPTAPDEAAIRTAITADGASGSTAYYAVIAYITVASGTTDITSGEIASGGQAMVKESIIGNYGSVNVLRLGNKKIMWGSDTVSSVANNTDKAKTVQFPESFNSVPSVTVTVSSWLALRMCITNSTTTSQTSVIVNHSQGSTINVPFNWIAIG